VAEQSHDLQLAILCRATNKQITRVSKGAKEAKSARGGVVLVKKKKNNNNHHGDGDGDGDGDE